jgi:hypothetical protein
LTILLFILRMAAIALLVFALLEPILNLLWRRTEEPVVVFLVDTSASMSISEGAVDRLSQAQALLEGDIMDEVGPKGHLVFYRFAEQAIPWSRGDSLRADGLATDLSGALETVKRELSDENLRGVIVLSDGIDNLGRNPANLARSYGLPIFSVGVGSADPRRDISVKEVLTPDVVYVDSRVPVDVIIQSSGLDGIQVDVLLGEGTEVLDRQQITLEGEGREGKVSLEYIPREEGVMRLWISVPPQDGELIEENNRRELSVRVLKSKMKVFLLWGQPSWDFSFLRNSLERDHNVILIPLVHKEEAEFFLGSFPLNEDRLRQHDVFILGDAAASTLTAEQQRWFSRLVTGEGKGLLLVGGPQFGLQPNSPLADLVPMSVPGKRIGSAQDRFWVELTSAGRVHPVMALQEEVLDRERIWQDLPPFLGLNPMGPPKAGANVLATHPTLKAANNPLPLIAVQQVGAGKCMMVAVFPLWRWYFMLVGLGQTGETYDRFWSNSIRWLATREEGQLIRISPVRRVFRSGQRIAFQGRLLDESYRPMDRAQVKVFAMRKETPQRVEIEGGLFESGRRDGHYRGELPVLSPGEYLYRAEVYLGGQKVGQDEGEFLVEEYSLEFERVALDHELLREMARASGGRYFPIDEVTALPAALQFQRRETSRQRELELWNHPVLLVLLVLLLAAEWTIRKKNRLM